MSTDNDTEVGMHRTILASLQRGTHLPGLPSPLPTVAAGGAGMATGTVPYRPVTTIGSVQVTQGNFIEVRSEGVWYKDTISKVHPDEIEVRYVGSLGGDRGVDQLE